MIKKIKHTLTIYQLLLYIIYYYKLYKRKNDYFKS